jgi:hypothetical protein
MKLLHRLRTMSQGIEAAADTERDDVLPGMNRDDFLDPPSEEAFEPTLGQPATRHTDADTARR